MVRICYVEIYLERVNDLMVDGAGGQGSPAEDLPIKEDK